MSGAHLAGGGDPLDAQWRHAYRRRARNLLAVMGLVVACWVVAAGTAWVAVTCC